MATVVARPPAPVRQSPTPPPLPPTLTLNTSSRGIPVPVPNKHIPVCPTGPSPAQTPATPPASPPTKHLSIQTSSILHPTENYLRIIDSPPVYSIDPPTLAAALDHIATQPLPEPKQVFPWLHGLHPENHIQITFFAARRSSLRRTPTCIRGVTIVKAGGEMNKSKLKGAIAPEELLSMDRYPDFLEADPKDGFSVRNFQIQVMKMARVSDIVVYGDEDTQFEVVESLAARISMAQRAWKDRNDSGKNDPPPFNTFVLSSPFHEIEKNHPELVALDSRGCMTGHVVDFFSREREEMFIMSQASEFCNDVFLGPTPDPALHVPDVPSVGEEDFDILIETSDMARLPTRSTLQHVVDSLEQTGKSQRIEFPSSGSIMPPTWSHTEVDGLVDMCRWIYELANARKMLEPEEELDSDGDKSMVLLNLKPRRILIHCADGYTESSLLALTYCMYAEGIPVHEAWLRMHCEKKRNFFAYPSDVALLTCIQPRLLQESPRQPKLGAIAEPSWLARMDGSLPSRILPYMYLGNLGHANNPELLKALGIKRILSVGESIAWTKAELESWGQENLMFVDQVQDNGVDPLTEDFDRCLEFIERGRLDSTATLVHCRVGVSRSATICIAEVMSQCGLSFPRAYCFVRARRLNVIIQPHLRFSYELLKWEEHQQRKRNETIKRELEWATIAQEIALMNKPYSR
ncbi:MAG: hypothetical protein M1819_001451 [Sarea resinae]|nr:MAG: hypothetical protein M1819_001451 [Sarea resinae]